MSDFSPTYADLLAAIEALPPERDTMPLGEWLGREPTADEVSAMAAACEHRWQVRGFEQYAVCALCGTPYWMRAPR